MTLMIFLVAIAALAALPFVMEALRRPLSDRLRAETDGDYAALTQGATHYKWHGPKSDRIMVLVHGVSTPSWVFDGLIRGLQMMRFRVLSYDLYGRGLSDRATGKQDIEFHRQQLDELLGALGIRVPVSLMGFSLGGAIATAFTARDPDRVDRLILLAPAGIATSPGALQKIARERGVAGAWLWGLLGGWALRRAAKRAGRLPSVLPDVAERVARETNKRGFLPAVLSSEVHALTETQQPDHREVAAMYIPTLAIFGDADTAIPISAVGTLAQWNRPARIEVIEGAGHTLPYTHPKEVLGAIRTFLREVPE